MKSINNPYEFYNKHPLNHLVMEENKYSKINYEISSLILPHLKQIAKRLLFYEYIYLNDQNLFNQFKENKFFSFENEFSKSKISHFFFPKKNNKYFLHRSKFKIKMLKQTLHNYFQNQDTIDIFSTKLCFYKPNELALRSSNFNNFEQLNIENFNNFENEFLKNDFEIFSDVEKIVSNLFENYFRLEIFKNIIEKCIKDFVIHISFLHKFLNSNLRYPNNENIIVGSESRILSKLIRYKLIRKDYKIYSFEHGARSLLFKHDVNILNEHRLKYVSKYFLTGKGQYEIAQKYNGIQKKIELSKNIEPKIKNVITRKFKNSNNKKILCVMSNTDFNIIFSRQPTGLLYFYHKNLFNDLLNFFQKNNYYFKVKNHPDSIKTFIDKKNSTNGTLLNLFDEFDILLFDHSTSTAFCEAINSNKKIILLNFKQNYFEDKFNEIIKKRCLIINVEIDFLGNIKIDENYLKDCIENDSSEFKNNYMQIRSFFS